LVALSVCASTRPTDGGDEFFGRRFEKPARPPVARKGAGRGGLPLEDLPPAASPVLRADREQLAELLCGRPLTAQHLPSSRRSQVHLSDDLVQGSGRRSITEAFHAGGYIPAVVDRKGATALAEIRTASDGPACGTEIDIVPADPASTVPAPARTTDPGVQLGGGFLDPQADDWFVGAGGAGRELAGKDPILAPGQDLGPRLGIPRCFGHHRRAAFPTVRRGRLRGCQG